MQLLRQFLLILVVAQSTLGLATPQQSHNTAATKAPVHASPRTSKPNIILITLDTTRADRMGFLGSKRGLTPNLDAMAQDAAVFTKAYTQVPLTTPSHATILTGTYPQFHGLIDFPMALPKDVPYGPAILHAHGYRTAAFVGSMALAPGTIAPGFERGFDTYNADFHPDALEKKRYHKKDRYHTIDRPGEEVVSLALSWLNHHSTTPFFLWVHLYDAHAPYEQPEPYQTRYASEPYDGGIAYEDAAIGRFIRELKARNLYDGAVIALMADHGESLGAHQEQTHGVFVYDETIHVPLVIKLPHPPPGKQIESRVELADVMPTVFQGVGMSIPPAMQGKSLLDLIRTGDGGAGDDWRDRPAYSQADYARLSYGWSALQSWRSGKYLYIEAPTPELYDLTTDPSAEHNLARSSPAVAETLSAKLKAFREATQGHQETASVKLDPDLQQKLAALGYAASSNANAKSSDKAEDPKDRVESLRLIESLTPVLEDARFEEAIPILVELIAKEPNMSQPYMKLGGCYMQLKQYANAVPVLRRALEFDPGNIGIQMNLGKALIETRDFRSATTVLEDIVAKAPERLTAHVFLEYAYFGSDRFAEAKKESEDVLAISPQDFDSYLILGGSIARLGQLEASIPKLKKAVALRPEASKPHLFLAAIYTKLGRTEEAEREKAEGLRLRAKRSTSETLPDASFGTAKPD